MATKTLAPQILAAAAVPGEEAALLLEEVKNQANTVLKSALGTTPLETFATTGLGNFPYYWENPNNLEFNKLTYDWINANLAPGKDPLEQETGSTFTNLFIKALASTTFKLSAANQAALNQAQTNATNQQAALLKQWQSIYGLPTPPAGETVIDVIVDTILTKWATAPPATLMDVQNSSNLNQLLGKTPASGAPILPLLANWVNALAGSVPLQNAVSMNNGYKNAALDNVQKPSASNGAISISGSYYPAYEVSTPLANIINDLQDTTREITLQASVLRANSNEYKVTIGGGTSFNIPFLSFFSLGIGTQANYFRDVISTSATSIEMTIKYAGLSVVQYQAVPFSKSNGQDWFFMEPIREAIANGPTLGQDGFYFGVNPGIDFSESGPFGKTQGVAISNFPSIEIKIVDSNYMSIEQTINQQSSVSLSFLGIPLGGVSQGYYQHNASVDSSSSSVTIRLNPPPTMIASTNTDARGWILGAQADFPGA